MTEKTGPDGGTGPGDGETHAEIEAEIESREFDGYRANGTVWRADDTVGECGDPGPAGPATRRGHSLSPGTRSVRRRPRRR